MKAYIQKPDIHMFLMVDLRPDKKNIFTLEADEFMGMVDGVKQYLDMIPLEKWTDEEWKWAKAINYKPKEVNDNVGTNPEKRA